MRSRWNFLVVGALLVNGANAVAQGLGLNAGGKLSAEQRALENRHRVMSQMQKPGSASFNAGASSAVNLGIPGLQNGGSGAQTNGNANAGGAAASNAAVFSSSEIGIPGLGKGKSGVQVTSRIPEVIRQRRDEIRLRQQMQFEAREQFRERDSQAPALSLRAQGQATAQARFERRPIAAGPNQDAETGRPGVRTSVEVSHGQNHRAYVHADRLLAQRLAQIDQLRERYLENGDERLLEQADQLEQLARRQFERRLDGREPSQEVISPSPVVNASAVVESQTTVKTVSEP